MPLKGPIVAFGLAALASVATPVPNDTSSRNLHVGSRDVAWRESKWPFPVDQWGTGRAYLCPTATCGAELNLYLRAKVGFCNCDTGVADDAEVDRVADVELLGDRYAPAGEGRPVTIGWMKGRSRAYSLETSRGARRVLAIAFNDKCDVVVATVVAERALPVGTDDAALAFLNGNQVLQWAKAELGAQ
jgi:hypothetical protein